MEKHRRAAFMAALARVWRRSPAAPAGLAASGVSLGEVARLPPDEALRNPLQAALVSSMWWIASTKPLPAVRSSAILRWSSAGTARPRLSRHGTLR